LKAEIAFIFELHAWASKAIVVFIVINGILLKADPAKLVLALVALDMVAAVLLLDGRTALGALPI
jgi:hypothetical protein